MNAYAVFVLCALLLEYGVQLAADLLNLRSLRPSPPVGFEDVYDRAEYERSQAYTRAKTRLGIASGGAHLVAVLAFWFAGGFGALDELVRGLGLAEVPTGLVYIAALALASHVFGLPFALYGTFVVEERFGFNRTDARTFWMDELKGLALGALLGGPLVAAILFLFGAAGSWAWLACWAVVTVFVVAVQAILPTWILPLFNRFEPLEEGELRKAIVDYANSVSFPLEGIFVIDGSRRSTKSNAFFTGFGRRKRVALFDTLIERHSVPELVAVVAHEIGHYKEKHILVGMLLSIVQSGIVFALMGFFLRQEGLYEAFGIAQPSVYTGLVLFGLLYTPIALVLSVAVLAVSRRNEFAADRFSVRTTGRREAMANALKRLSSENLTNLTPHPFHVLVNHSHPPVVARVAAIQAVPE